MEKKKVLLIDSYSILFKAYYAIREMHTHAGQSTNAIFGFLNMLIKLRDTLSPCCIFAAFDHSRKNFRHALYDAYKANRQETPEDLREQSSLLKELLCAMNIPIVEVEGYEADDILGTASVCMPQKDYEVILVTGDRDSFALARDHAKILYCKRGVSDTILVDEAYIRDTYGVEPSMLTTVKALMGDASDNIPGVKGVGEKTALRLVQQYSTLDNLYSHIDEQKGALKQKLLDGREMAYTSYALAKINCSVPVVFDFARAQQFDLGAKPALEKMGALELHSIVKKLSFETKPEQAHSSSDMPDASKTETNCTYIIVDAQTLPSLCTLMQTEGIVSVYYDAHSKGLYIANQTQIYVLKPSMLTESVLHALWESPVRASLLCNETKTLAKKLYACGISPTGFVFDTQVAGYVLDPTDSRYTIHDLCLKYLEQDYALPFVRNKVQLSLFDEDVEEDSVFIAYGFWCDKMFKLYDVMRKRIEEEDMTFLYDEIEHKLIFVLAKMELEGIKIDIDLLRELKEKYTAEIESLTEQIKKQADMGETFNPNSTKQLGALLFEKRKLPVIKKTKTGYSTDVEVLEALKGMDPVVDMVLRLRQITKLYSTYIVGLETAIDPVSGKVHTTFNQTITETGRISSSNPNLQNIPIRTKEGEVLRKLFVAQEGETLVDGDYSQIELRVLAHIAQDATMQDAFNHDEDIHTRTASEVFDVKPEDVDAEMRRRAKAVNFGIIYGISDYGLSKDLGITRAQAKSYIEKYLHKYNSVALFMYHIVQYAREHGYVKTLFGRKRTLPGINSKNFNLRSFNERTALNTPIQGTAADVIKMAMIRVHEAIEQEEIQAKLLLQVHDELILSCAQKDAASVASFLKKTMQDVVDFQVVLKADVKTGESWYDAK